MDEFNNSQQNNADNTPDSQPQFDQPQVDQPQYEQPQYEQPQYSGESQYQQTSGQEYQYGQNYNEYPEPKKTDSFAIVSLVCGICSLVFGCCLYVVTWIPAIVGLVFGILSIKRNQNGNKGMAIAGVILSALALLLAIVFIIFAVVFATSGVMSEFQNLNY